MMTGYTKLSFFKKQHSNVSLMQGIQYKTLSSKLVCGNRALINFKICDYSMINNSISSGLCAETVVTLYFRLEGLST